MNEDCVERIAGPFKGYFVAVYAAPAEPGGGYVAYAKVCRSEPVSYWEADCLLKDGIRHDMVTPEQAMDVTIELARLHIACLPPIDELPAIYRLRSMHSHEQPVRRLLTATVRSEGDQ